MADNPQPLRPRPLQPRPRHRYAPRHPRRTRIQKRLRLLERQRGTAQRYVTGWNTERDKPDYKNAFFFTLQLKSLSNIGNKADETLRPAIPGYIKTNEVVK
ncbi:hypothetical protein LVJ84_09275 [Kingella potus]|nr:hypothetical protein [Kingella potus]UOP00136.1 hypothetical protein LVJ84_09275 [Kingella potus]